MDRETDLAHFASAEKAVIEGERHIQHQEQVVAELDRDGHNTAEALALLATFRKIQAQHVPHRDFLLRNLGGAGEASERRQGVQAAVLGFFRLLSRPGIKRTDFRNRSAPLSPA